MKVSLAEGDMMEDQAQADRKMSVGVKSGKH